MQRRKFSREYKLEAVKLVRQRGISISQAARDLDVHENVLRKWARQYGSDPAQAFPGNGQMKTEQLEIERALERAASRRRRSHRSSESIARRNAAAYFAKDVI